MYFLELAYKYCTEDGKWQNVTNLFGSTDYSSCYTPELSDMLKKLGSDYDTKVLSNNLILINILLLGVKNILHYFFKRKLIIATNTGLIEIVGCFVSIVSLIISLCIFIRHK